MPYTGNMTVHYNNLGTTQQYCNVYGGCALVGNQAASTGAIYGLNAFTNPGTVYSEFRPCVLGFDTSCGGYYNLRGLPTWNLDMNLIKDLSFLKEGRVGAQFFVLFTNVLNHFQPSNPSLSLNSPGTFGQITGQSNTPRQMELGLRIHF